MAILRDLPHHQELAVQGNRLVPVTQKTAAERVLSLGLACTAALSAAAALYLYYRYSFFQPHYTSVMRLGDVTVGIVLLPVWIACAVLHLLAHGSLRPREHAAFYAYLGIPLAASLVIHYGFVPLMSNMWILYALAVLLELIIPAFATAITALFTWKLIESQSTQNKTERKRS